MFQLVKRVIPSGQVFKGQLPLYRVRVYIFSKTPLFGERRNVGTDGYQFRKTFEIIVETIPSILISFEARK